MLTCIKITQQSGYKSSEILLRQVHEVAHTNLKGSLHRQKWDYDLRVNFKKYNIGDAVYKIN